MFFRGIRDLSYYVEWRQTIIGLFETVLDLCVFGVLILVERVLRDLV